jgi:hypothetical protein
MGDAPLKRGNVPFRTELKRKRPYSFHDLISMLVGRGIKAQAELDPNVLP